MTGASAALRDKTSSQAPVGPRSMPHPWYNGTPNLREAPLIVLRNSPVIALKQLPIAPAQRPELRSDIYNIAMVFFSKFGPHSKIQLENSTRKRYEFLETLVRSEKADFC